MSLFWSNKMHMLLLSYNTVACLFCLLVPLMFKGIYIYFGLLFLAVLCVCFIFWTLFCEFQFCTVLLRQIFAAKVPRSAQFAAVSVCFFLVSGLGLLWLSVVLRVLSSCSLLPFSPAIFMLFPLWSLFSNTCGFDCFYFFMLPLARLSYDLFMNACGPPVTSFLAVLCVCFSFFGTRKEGILYEQDCWRVE